MASYVIQGYCPTCDAAGHIYGGRFFADLPGQRDLAFDAIQEHSVQRIVVGRGDWIEFMIMTPGAADGEPQ